MEILVGSGSSVRETARWWPTVIVSAVDGPSQFIPGSSSPDLRRHIIEFHDTTNDRDASAFTAAHADEFVAFARSLTDDDRVIVHCRAGISRSTALAYGLFCVRGTIPADAIAEVERIRPIAQPNPLVVHQIGEQVSPEVFAAYEEWALGRDWWPGGPTEQRISSQQPAARLDAIRWMWPGR